MRVNMYPFAHGVSTSIAIDINQIDIKFAGINVVSFACRILVTQYIAFRKIPFEPRVINRILNRFIGKKYAIPIQTGITHKGGKIRFRNR